MYSNYLRQQDQSENSRQSQSLQQSLTDDDYNAFADASTAEEKSTKLQNEIEHIESEITAIQAKFDELARKFIAINQEQFQSLLEHIEQIFLKLQPQFNHTNQERSLAQAELHKLEPLLSEMKAEIITKIITEIKNSPIHHENLPEKDIAPVEETEDSRDEVIQTVSTPHQEISSSQSSALEQLPWVSEYNRKPDSFLKFSTEVSETKESINQRRLGTNQPLLEKVGKGIRGSYWLLTDDQSGIYDKSGIYLVPKGDLKITEFNLPTVQALFRCIGDVERSSKFILFQPAIVSPSESDKWQLVELGELHF
ncbi:hypothetical protein [Nostoc sp.]|uniref:hypothetical protein n=1 Tax=Nostoc sp. TaxID=1180 RepID=UPI003593B20D